MYRIDTIATIKNFRNKISTVSTILFTRNHSVSAILFVINHFLKNPC